jgi:hypothetical protein
MFLDVPGFAILPVHDLALVVIHKLGPMRLHFRLAITSG